VLQRRRASLGIEFCETNRVTLRKDHNI